MKKISLIIIGLILGVGFTITALAVTQGGFSDIKPSDWFYGPALEAQQLGLMKGVNGKFMPGEAVNRAQLAVVLQAAKKNIQSMIMDNDAGLLQTLGGVLLEGHHLYIYGTLFYKVPSDQNSKDDPQSFMKAKSVIKAFDVPKTDKFIYGPVSIYAESGWQEKKLSGFFIYKDGRSDAVKWYGPFFDNVQRLQGNLDDLK